MTTELTIDAGQLTSAYAEPQGTRAFLVVHVDEAGRPSTVVEVADGAEVTFGRSRGATVMVDHEKVSRLHARVWRNAERIHIEDLESKNGTRVNGERISGMVALSAGDEIAIGNATVVLRQASQVVGKDVTLTTGSCRDANLMPTVSASAQALRNAGLTRVRCVENSGAVVFERAL